MMVMHHYVSQLFLMKNKKKFSVRSLSYFSPGVDFFRAWQPNPKEQNAVTVTQLNLSYWSTKLLIGWISFMELNRESVSHGL